MGKPLELEIEAVYKQQIKVLRQKLKCLEEIDCASKDIDLELYTQKSEIKAYINNYRIALEHLKRYGKNYVGRKIDDYLLSGLTETEKAVFIQRFCNKKGFAEINRRLKTGDAQKVYERAYKKVIANLTKNKL